MKIGCMAWRSRGLRGLSGRMRPVTERFRRTVSGRGVRGLAVAAGLAAALLPSVVAATPQRVIILRHGEKKNGYELCSVGVERAKALASVYLGRNAGQTLFAHQPPSAFLAITLHTLELASPAAGQWGLGVDDESVMPEPKRDDPHFVTKLNERTQRAARSVLDDARWDGKTVVMVWEHHHIADAKLEAQFPGEAVTLRQLLGLDTLPDVPQTWPGGNYDYFWIVDFDPAKGRAPVRFRMVKQVFGPPWQNLPANDWGAPEVLPPGSDCEHRETLPEGAD